MEPKASDALALAAAYAFWASMENRPWNPCRNSSSSNNNNIDQDDIATQRDASQNDATSRQLKPTMHPPIHPSIMSTV
jgi:hypothetical protein